MYHHSACLTRLHMRELGCCDSSCSGRPKTCCWLDVGGVGLSSGSTSTHGSSFTAFTRPWHCLLENLVLVCDFQTRFTPRPLVASWTWHVEHPYPYFQVSTAP